MLKRSLFALLAFALFAFGANYAAATQIFITSGTTWTVPADWNSQDNTIEIIGAGGFGLPDCLGGVGSVGGGGGGYSKITNLAETPGSSVSVNFTANTLTDTGFVWLGSNATVLAMNGADGKYRPGGICVIGEAGKGGKASLGVGTTKFSGGNGGSGSGGGIGTGSGGGAAGPHGAGGSSSADSGIGGTADAGFGGAGGVSGVGFSAPGANGTEFDSTHGAGGGGGSNDAADPPASVGGNYGGGGGFGLNGGSGLIVITYTPRNRVSSGVF